MSDHERPCASAPCVHSQSDFVEIIPVPPANNSGMLKLQAHEGRDTCTIILDTAGAREIFNALGVWLHTQAGG